MYLTGFSGYLAGFREPPSPSYRRHTDLKKKEESSEIIGFDYTITRLYFVFADLHYGIDYTTSDT